MLFMWCSWAVACAANTAESNNIHRNTPEKVIPSRDMVAVKSPVGEGTALETVEAPGEWDAPGDRGRGGS